MGRHGQAAVHSAPRVWGGQLSRLGSDRSTVFETDRVMVPVHQPAHWALGLVDVENRRLVYYDSLGSSEHANKFHRVMRRWLEYEWTDKAEFREQERPLNLDGWEDVDAHNGTSQGIPQQKNDCDCGFFMLKFARSLFKGEDKFTFSPDPDEFAKFRLKVKTEVSQGELWMR